MIVPVIYTNMNKAVIFTRFARMADILVRELTEYNPACIQGSTVDREQQIQRFNTDDTCKLMIITTAASEGVNLQRANLLYFYDVPLGSYGSLVQIQGRIKRIGQNRPMVVYYMQAENTVDTRLKKLLFKKKDMANELFSDIEEVKEILV